MYLVLYLGGFCSLGTVFASVYASTLALRIVFWLVTFTFAAAVVWEAYMVSIRHRVTRHGPDDDTR